MDLRKTFARYTGSLREQKMLYVAHNLLHYGQLRQNKALYRKLGLQRSVLAPVSSRSIPAAPEEQLPWLDQPRVYHNLEADARYKALTPQLQQWVQQWCRDGYLILKGFASAERVQAINDEIARMTTEGRLQYNYTRVKIMDAFHKSPLTRAVAEDADILELMRLLLSRPVRPFQTINFVYGSQQRMHSDFIHMTTEPKGYLAAAWLALEPITPDNGPILYIPGSHRLPYILLPDFDHGGSRWRLGRNSYRAYEDRIARLVEEQGLQPQTLIAEPGDLLVWHANLLHAGAPIHTPGATRRSMVTHYFAEGVLCYHEITERPAVF